MQDDLQQRYFQPEQAVLAVIPASVEEAFGCRGEEFCGLLEAARWSVGGLIRIRESRNRKESAGEGASEIMRQWMQDCHVGLVVIDADLDPSVQRRLERKLDCPVLDRTALILAIFGRRAVSQAALYQVQLAQYQYLLPRLTRMWTHLGRITGGATGVRGKGEKQIELDRRLIRSRISELRTRLDATRRHRQRVQEGRRRSDLPQVSLVGYTNAGKSSLLEKISGETGLSENALFATLDAKVRIVKQGAHGAYLLADTVGFIERLNPELVSAFHATLEIAAYADLIVIVVDASDKDPLDHLRISLETLQAIGAGDVPRLVCLNKADLVADISEIQSLCEYGGVTAVPVSVLTGENLSLLQEKILKKLAATRVFVRIRLSATEAKKRARFYRDSLMTSETWDGEECVLSGYVPSSKTSAYCS